jgi:DNA-directed RNA polymerase specialized sigma24 family protein
MPSDDVGSVTRWVGDLKSGDQAAAAALWERYFDRLVRLARKRLVLARRTGADEDEEDAALSAFDSFCAGLIHGRYPQLGDREDLWKLLVVITARKAAAQADRRAALKRGGGWYAWTGATTSSADSGDWNAGLAALVSREPTPEFAALVAEESRRLLNRLGDPQLREIAVARMEGFTTDEIADRLGCARRTVARRLDLIRQVWNKEAP